jgi:hypothetical protein
MLVIDGRTKSADKSREARRQKLETGLESEISTPSFLRFLKSQSVSGILLSCSELASIREAPYF